MTILQNPVIPIVVRFSMSECSLRVENRHGDDVVERRSVMIYGDKRAAYDGTIACAARAVLLFTQET